ncbi:MAG TPA: hypothetical protein VFA04_12300 [Bryobacteraceae bacterium]|nr:hypothetical protein [Bryobacteraceae bacterium]
MMRTLLLIGALAPAGIAAAEPVTVEQAYRQMYDLDFAGAHRTLAAWEASHPADPMGPASDAAAWLYGEFDRMHILQSELFVDDNSFFHSRKQSADPAVKQKFEDDLAKARQLADAALKNDPSDGNALLARMLCTGLHSDYLALIEKRYLAALSEVKITRAMAEKALAIHPDLYDAYIAIGEENYILSQKAAPVRWILHMSGSETDKQTGIEKLRLTAEKGRYFGPYARLLLAVADLRDKNKAHARQKLAWLAAQFPHNRLYRDELAKLRS